MPPNVIFPAVADHRNDLLDRLQYVALRTVSMMLHCWPIEWNLAGARFIGSCIYHFDKKHRDRGLHNLSRSFPDLADRDRRQMARRSVQQLIMLGCDVLFTTRLVRIDTFARFVVFEEFRETLKLLLSKNQGAIFITGHYGNWEILGYVLATLGFETTSIARPLDNPYINDWLLGVRERQGQRILSKRGATEVVEDVLERHGAVGFIADQNAGKKGIFVDFFGRAASTYKSIGLLAMRHNVPVVIGGARRLNESFRFACGTEDIIYPQDWADEPDPLRYITQRYTTAIENLIRKDPGQYLWVHRRWKTRPKGEAPEVYD